MNQSEFARLRGFVPEFPAKTTRQLSPFHLQNKAFLKFFRDDDLCCPECGYDLRGIPERRCPECGFRYDREGIISLDRDWCAARIADLRLAAALQLAGSLVTLFFGILGIGWQLFLVGGIAFSVALGMVAAVMLLQTVNSGVTLQPPRELWLWWFAGIALLLLMWAAGASQGDSVWALFVMPGALLGAFSVQKYRRKSDTPSRSMQRQIPRLRRWAAINIAGIVTSICVGVVQLSV